MSNPDTFGHRGLRRPVVPQSVRERHHRSKRITNGIPSQSSLSSYRANRALRNNSLLVDWLPQPMHVRSAPAIAREPARACVPQSQALLSNMRVVLRSCQLLLPASSDAKRSRFFAIDHLFLPQHEVSQEAGRVCSTRCTCLSPRWCNGWQPQIHDLRLWHARDDFALKHINLIFSTGTHNITGSLGEFDAFGLTDTHKDATVVVSHCSLCQSVHSTMRNLVCTIAELRVRQASLRSSQFRTSDADVAELLGGPFLVAEKGMNVQSVGSFPQREFQAVGFVLLCVMPLPQTVRSHAQWLTCIAALRCQSMVCPTDGHTTWRQRQNSHEIARLSLLSRCTAKVSRNLTRTTVWPGVTRCLFPANEGYASFQWLGMDLQGADCDAIAYTFAENTLSSPGHCHGISSTWLAPTLYWQDDDLHFHNRQLRQRQPENARPTSWCTLVTQSFSVLRKTTWFRRCSSSNVSFELIRALSHGELPFSVTWFAREWRHEAVDGLIRAHNHAERRLWSGLLTWRDA